jgi:hypothetical protein
MLRQGGNAKVTEQDLIAAAQQHVLWFDIAMDQSLIMSTLEGIGYLLRIGNHCRQRKRYPFRMALTQRAMRGKIHHQKGDIVFYAKLQNAHDVRVYQVRNEACFQAKASETLIVQLSTQYFNRSQSTRVNMSA